MEKKYEDAMQVLHKMVLEMSEKEIERLKEKVRELERENG